VYPLWSSRGLLEVYPLWSSYADGASFQSFRLRRADLVLLSLVLLFLLFFFNYA